MSWVSSIFELFSPSPTYREVGYLHLDIENQLSGLKAFEYGDVLQKDQIRLAKLLKGADGTPIHCELFTTSVTRESYKALSYAWGDSRLTNQIVCNGQRLMITANLHSALTHLREAGEHVLPLWIDSICIRQNHAREKTQQVRDMKQTFEEAAEVIIWLGPSTEGTETGLEIIKEVAKRKHINVLSRIFSYFAGTDLDMIHQRSFDLELRGLPPRDSEIWRYVGDILQRSWFSRLWVVQEVLAAKKSIMRIGLLTIDTMAMLAAFHEFGTRMNYATIWSAAEIMPCRLYGVYLFRFLVRPQIRIIWLPDVLFHLRNFKCTDPRDRIFAALGCFSNELDHIVDYEITWRQLLLTVAKGPFDGASETDPGINPPTGALTYLFKSLDFIDSRYADPSIPSWCQTWASSNGFVPLFMIYQPERKIVSGDHQSVYFIDDNVLSLLGKRMGRIRSIVETSLPITWEQPPCTDVEIPKITEEFAKYEDRCFDLAKRTLTTTCPEEVVDVYAKCLTFHDSASSFNVKAARDALHAWRKLQLLDCALSEETLPPELVARMAKQFTLDELTGGRISAESVRAIHARSYDDSVLISMGLGYAKGREFFASGRGNIGWAPPGAKVGDEICVFHGCKLPFVIRQAAQPGHSRLIGSCYVGGFMDGEALELPVETTTIKLV